MRGALLGMAMVALLGVGATGSSVRYIGLNHDVEADSTKVTGHTTLSYDQAGLPISSSSPSGRFGAYAVEAGGELVFHVDVQPGQVMFFSTHLTGAIDVSRSWMKLVDGSGDLLANITFSNLNAGSVQTHVAITGATDTSSFMFSFESESSDPEALIFFSSLVKVYTPNEFSTDGAYLVDFLTNTEIPVDASEADVGPADFVIPNTLPNYLNLASQESIKFNVSNLVGDMAAPVLQFVALGQHETVDGSLLFNVRATNGLDFIELLEASVGSFDVDLETTVLKATIPLLELEARNAEISIVSGQDQGTTSVSPYVLVYDAESSNYEMATSMISATAGSATFEDVIVTDDMENIDNGNTNRATCKQQDLFIYKTQGFDTPYEMPGMCGDGWVVLPIPNAVETYENPWLELSFMDLISNEEAVIELWWLTEAILSASDINPSNAFLFNNFTQGRHAPFHGMMFDHHVPISGLEPEHTHIGIRFVASFEAGRVFSSSLNYFNSDATPTPSPTMTASETASYTETPSETASTSETTSETATASQSETTSETATASQSETPSETASQSETPSETASASTSASPSETASPSQTPSQTPSISLTPTQTPSASPSVPADVPTSARRVVAKFRLGFGTVDTADITVTSLSSVRTALASLLGVPAANIEILEIKVVTNKASLFDIRTRITESSSISAENITSTLSTVEDDDFLEAVNEALSNAGSDLVVTELEVQETEVETSSAASLQALTVTLAAVFVAALF